jgi:phospholipid/cholesterol/gamma-HCH transport system substrate-binding protein
MKKERNALRAGLFMVVSLVLVIFIIIAISGAGRFTQSFTTYPVAFALSDDIGGLRVGDDVRIGGLKVGSVRDIEIRAIPDDAQLADSIPPGQPAMVVYIDLPSRYPLSQDADIAVQKTITGSAAINIDSLGTGTPVASAEYLRGKPDALSALFHRLGSVEPDIHAIVTNLRTASVKLNTTLDSFSETGFTASATVHDLHARLPEIVARYDDVTDSAVHVLDVIHEFLGPTTGDFHATMKNIHGLTGDLHERLPDLLNQLRSILQKTDLSVSRAAGALKDIQETAANARELTASLREVVTGNQSKLAAIISSLKATSDNLKYASMEIRHSPWRLLYQPKPDEVANLNTYDSVRQFAEGATTLDDAAAALRDAVKDPNADPEQVKKLMSNLDDSFAKFEAVQDKLWKDIKE